jgi:hypothetical protein
LHPLVRVVNLFRPFVARRVRLASMAVIVAVALVASACEYNWLQFGGTAVHSGNDGAESTITLANAPTLHRVWQATLPIFADGAPVVLRNVTTASGSADMVFVTTRGGGIVALDAGTGAQLWAKTFGPGSCKINNGSTTCYTTSSPAIDPSGVFVYSYGLDGKVHKLSVADGAETITGGWPELVTLKGFDEKGSSQLSIVTAKSGASFLYMVTAGYPGDRGDYQGHLVAVNLATGAQKVYNTLCSDQTVHFATTPGMPDCAEVQSGVWARAGTLYDPANDRLFISSGNGTYAPASHHWGDTVVALNPDGSAKNATGEPLDAYTPANFQFLDDSDQDLGSTLPAILPVPSTSAVKQLAIMSGKDAKLRLLNLDNLSGHGAAGFTGGEIGPIIPVPQGGVVLTQPTVWVNPADSSTWVFVSNNSGSAALKVTFDGSGNPSLAVQWQNAVKSTTPLVANGVLYLAQGTRVGAYTPTTGANVWSDTTLGSLHWQTPVVNSGMLLMEDGSGHVNAYTN